ncbi:hypothetical protein QBC39DRAFT_246577 [Podospora conica]|nr:hypothetical protein QBC39DRAFT_246577 [Schizothecium conicum]
MKFTPVKIRGKKGASNQPRQLTSGQKRHSKENRTTAADSTSKPERRHRRPKPRRTGTALIEKLPYEILEHIFCLSGNLNFPKSSPYIGCALSSRLTLLRFVVEAFAPTWDACFGRGQDRVDELRLLNRKNARSMLRFGGDPQLQSHVLACRRVDISVLLDAQKLWLRRQTAPRTLEMPPFPESQRDIFGLDIANVYLALFGLLPVSEYTQHLYLYNPASSIDMHPMARIPDGLLAGPLDEGKAKLLFWFVRQGAQLDDRQTWEATDRVVQLTKLGFENIKKEKNPKLRLVWLGLFHRLAIFNQWPNFLRHEAIDHAVEWQERIDSGSIPPEEGWAWDVMYMVFNLNPCLITLNLLHSLAPPG